MHPNAFGGRAYRLPIAGLNEKVRRDGSEEGEREEGGGRGRRKLEDPQWHTVEPTTSKVTGLVSEAVSMAVKTTCPPMTSVRLTLTPEPGAPDMYGHMLPLQISSLTKRDNSVRSATRASLYRSRQAAFIGGELTVRISRMECFSTWGFAAAGCCATAEPETSASSAHDESTCEVHRKEIY